MHPYYAGLLRWIAANPPMTVSSLAKSAGLDNSTLRKGIDGGSAPATTTIEKLRSRTGLAYDEIINFDPDQLSGKPQGLSEGDVAAWKPKASRDEPSSRIADMGKLLAGGRGGRDIWQVTSRAMILAGYAEGDFVLVDQHAHPEAGSIVLAQVYDWELGSATTLLRRYDPPVLTAASTDPAEWRPYVVDGKNVRIMGVVTASWRV